MRPQHLWGLVNLAMFRASVGFPDPFTVWSTPSSPLLPSQDPFYTSPPKDLSSYPPGTLLRARVAPGNLSAMFNASAVHNLVYRTTDSNDRPTWALTTVFSPLTPYRSGGDDTGGDGSALLSYQYPYNTVDLDKSISVLMHDPSTLPGLADVTAALQRGWFVSVPDYEGVQAASIACKLESQAVLDGVAATFSLASKPKPTLPDALNLHLDAALARFVLWGYSGGSFPSVWAAELSSSPSTGYAPALRARFAGIAVGGMVPDWQPTIDAVEGTVFAGLTPPALLGITAQWPAHRAWLLSRIRPENASAFLAVEGMSATESFAAFAGQTIADYFVGGRADFAGPEIQGLALREFDMGYHGVPGVPVFAYKAIGDEFAPIGLSDALVKKYCAEGANIWYERNTVGGHLDEFQNGHTRSLAFIQSLFNGSHAEIYGDRGCVVSNVTVVDPSGADDGTDPWTLSG